jgi:S-methylmethionine-dependent homocysteine/selenocysteine methylase
MAQYRTNLPQLSSDLFIADGGLETTLIFHQSIDLPEFAAFDLLKSSQGIKVLKQYFQTYAAMAVQYQVGLILESATWRANPDWGQKLGYDPESLVEMNRRAIALLQEIRTEYETEQSRIVISGCLGPRGDGYIPSTAMSVEEAKRYHQPQIETLRDADADLISAFTINYVEEAIGIVLAAQTAGMPVVISFTVETDGHLPTGQSLKDAIQQVDAATDNGPVYYMINCAHPTHFATNLAEGEPWTERIRGIRANSSRKSHAELNDSVELDAGNPAELGQQYRELKQRFPHLTVFGGCCGTDERHIVAICQACLPVFWASLTQQELVGRL